MKKAALPICRAKYRDAEHVVMGGSGFRVRKLTPKEIEAMQVHIEMLRSHGPRKRVPL